MEVAQLRIENCVVDYDNETNTIDQFSVIHYDLIYTTKYTMFEFKSMMINSDECEDFLEFYNKIQEKQDCEFNNQEIVMSYSDNTFKITPDGSCDFMFSYGFPMEDDAQHSALMERLSVIQGKCKEFADALDAAQEEEKDETKKLSSFVATIVAREAVGREDTCPITLEPLVLGKVGVLHCGHCFDSDALKKSLRKCTMCPTCRDESEPCFV